MCSPVQLGGWLSSALPPPFSTCRHPPGPAASDLRWQAARGWAHAGGLQHPEGVHPAPGAAPARRHHRALAHRPRAQVQRRQDDLPQVSAPTQYPSPSPSPSRFPPPPPPPPPPLSPPPLPRSPSLYPRFAPARATALRPPLLLQFLRHRGQRHYAPSGFHPLALCSGVGFGVAFSTQPESFSSQKPTATTYHVPQKVITASQTVDECKGLPLAHFISCPPSVFGRRVWR